MQTSKIRNIFLLILGLAYFSSGVSAEEINLFGGILKIRTYDSNDHRRDDRHHRDDNNGHYEYRHGKLVWVEEDNRVHGHYELRHGKLIWVEDRRDDDDDIHIIYDEPEEWVLLTRIINDDFDWVIIESSNKHKIKKLMRKGYQRSMTGLKESCYKMGKKKERLWKKHHVLWQ